MGKHQLRDESTCLNCGYHVEEKYCTRCGQENTTPRKSFSHLFTHFVEDLTHYDSAFWKTIKYLLFRPARLTREYLSGKRKSFVPPVKLYIFINFITFFLIAALPSDSSHILKAKENGVPISLDSIKNDKQKPVVGDFTNVAEFDSIQNAKPPSKRLTGIRYWVKRKLAEVSERTQNEDFGKKFGESFLHNLPKVLFLYMPFFALALWLLHGKKRWFYFDHGIFTLHYFSFILLTLSCFFILAYVNRLFGDTLHTIMSGTFLIITGWWFFYFFRSHRLMYGESWMVSTGKGLVLFIINLACILFFLMAAMIYTILNID